jgi:hypothetical protein
MPQITNPEAVRFANERSRPLADLVAGAFQAIQAYWQAWDAKALGDVIPDDESVVADGSETDGRTPITGHDLHQLKALCDDLVGMGLGENTKIPIVLKVAVNPRVL